MSRPIDILLEYLETERARGATHVHLDEEARDGLRNLFERSRIPVSRPSEAETGRPVPSAATTPAVLAADGETKAERLASLRRQAQDWQPARVLGTLRDTMVFASGNPEARVMLVGEAPGYQEEKEREPFVGPAGQKLNDILRAMGLSRANVYVSYIVKFRPAMDRQTTNNRKASPEEMAACLPFVRAEIAIVRPECVIALGGTAAEGLLGLSGSVGSMRGVWHDFEGTPVRVTYHPSYLLQSGGSSQVKRLLWEDMLSVMEKLGMEISAKQRAFFLPKA